MSNDKSEVKFKRSSISSLTIVNQQGTKQFFVGSEYNGILLERIEDETVDAEEIYVPIFRGYAKHGIQVFETINAPIEVSYSMDT